MKNSVWLSIVIFTVILMLAFLLFYGNRGLKQEDITQPQVIEKTQVGPTGIAPTSPPTAPTTPATPTTPTAPQQ